MSDVVTVVTTHWCGYAGGVTCWSALSSVAGTVLVSVLSVRWRSGVLLSIPIDVNVYRWDVVGRLVVVLGI